LAINEVLYLLSAKNDSSSLRKAIKGMKPQEVINGIEYAIDSALGNGAGVLVFKTLSLIYNFQKDEIPSNIERFEELLDKIFGKAAEPLRKRIVSELQIKKQQQ
jgi:hypothetical protein